MNYRELDGAINALASKLGSFQKRDGAFWKSAWADVRSIGQGFKVTKYPSRDDHQAAWNRFQTLVQGMKDERERHQRKREEQDRKSSGVRSSIESLAKEADPSSGAVGEILAHLSGFSTLKMIGRGMLESAGMLEASDGIRERKAALQRRNAVMKRAWASFESNKQLMTPGDRAACFDSLKATSDRLQEAWASWKQLSSDAWEARQARRQAREADFQSRRTIKSRLIDEVSALDPTSKSDAEAAKGMMSRWKSVGFAGKDYEDRLWAQFRGALDSFWQQRKAGAVARLTGALEKQLEFRSRLCQSLEMDKANLEKFSGLRDSARTDDFRYKMCSVLDDISSRVSGKLSKLEDVNDSIEDLQRKIRDMD